MSSLLLRHYDVTLAYRTFESERKVRDLRWQLRMFLNRRQLKRKLRTFFATRKNAE